MYLLQRCDRTRRRGTRLKGELRRRNPSPVPLAFAEPPKYCDSIWQTVPGAGSVPFAKYALTTDSVQVENAANDACWRCTPG